MKAEAAALQRLVGRFQVSQQEVATIEAPAKIAPIAFVPAELPAAQPQRLGLRAPAQPSGEWRTF